MVIINADDYGYSSSVNKAISICFNNGIINRTTAMTTLPAFQECYILARKNGYVDKVGLHLVLDEGCPLSDKIKLNPHICKDGYFIKGWFTQPLRRLYLTPFDKECLEDEISAQMIKFRGNGFTSRHLDSHHFVHTSSPAILSIIIKQAARFGFLSMRTVFVTKNEPIIKRVLKAILKAHVKRRFITTDHFAPYSQYLPSMDNIEYMMHPDIIDGVVVDYINRKTGETAYLRSID